MTQIFEATGWASHMVRGFLTELKKKVFWVSILEQERRRYPNKQETKGDHTIYVIVCASGATK